MQTKPLHHRSDLVRIATQVMLERGLQPEFSAEALRQLKQITGPSDEAGDGIHDLTSLLWCSIDNDDSEDLDQLTVCETLKNGNITGMISVNATSGAVFPHWWHGAFIAKS